jgi:integrase
MTGIFPFTYRVYCQRAFMQVTLIMGMAGACRMDELRNMTVEDIEEKDSVLLVRIPFTKTDKPRSFVVADGGDDSFNAVEIYKKYASLRPAKVGHNRLFLTYRNGKCTVQPVGKNTFSSIPKKIADFLKLPNSALYTGHSFRRSSATLLADTGADLLSLKRHGGWSSSSVAEGYIDECLTNKVEVANKILRGIPREGASKSRSPMSIPATVTTTSKNKSHAVDISSIGGLTINNCQNVKVVFQVRNEDEKR